MYGTQMLFYESIQRLVMSNVSITLTISTRIDMKKLIASTALPCLKRPGNCLLLASGGPTYTESSCLIDSCKDEFTVRHWTLNGSFESFSMQWSARTCISIDLERKLIPTMLVSIHQTLPHSF
mmetsp:Transcript_4852/g.8963  ORF Transcript_4852/g.8963 Transcript_4852/m.8963 type:complete len:123 (+) Transcript_4852:619-987(+)